MINLHNMKVGILGAGQLAQMLALAAPPLGLRTHILASYESDPAAYLGKMTFGSLNNEETIREFAKNLDLLTFESEFISANLIRQATAGLSLRIFPSLENLARFQDRSSQKQFLDKYRIPTAPWLKIADQRDLDLAYREFNGRFVLKVRTQGYDGKGTFYCRSVADLENLKNLLAQYPQGFIAEELQKFSRELAIIIARSQDGSIINCPLVFSQQRDSRCELVYGPIRHTKISPLLKLIHRGLKSIDYVGIIAFELFDNQGKLVVNEIAPRVHNSGHYSQLALNHSQFKLHWLCGMGEKLPELQTLAPAFGMLNLIGESSCLPEITNPASSTLNWYNKKDNRLGRKMGHLNALGKNLKTVQSQLIKDKRKIIL